MGLPGCLARDGCPSMLYSQKPWGPSTRLSAALGLARAACQADQSGPIILEVQRDLYNLMTEIAASPKNTDRFAKMSAERVVWLETQTDTLNAIIEMPDDFILSGDSAAGAALDLSRTIVRRAERRVAELWHKKILQNQEVLRYMNRLSSLCFVLELLENQAAGKTSTTLAKG